MHHCKRLDAFSINLEACWGEADFTTGKLLGTGENPMGRLGRGGMMWGTLPERGEPPPKQGKLRQTGKPE